jgi:hypothetical protein
LCSTPHLLPVICYEVQHLQVLCASPRHAAHQAGVASVRYHYAATQGLLVLLQVLKAEASSPLVSGQQLQDAGQMPRVLVQGTAAGLVATPAAQERQEMYHKETEYTGNGGNTGACVMFQACLLNQLHVFPAREKPRKGATPKPQSVIPNLPAAIR